MTGLYSWRYSTVTISSAVSKGRRHSWFLRRCRQYRLQNKYLQSAHRAGEAPLAYFKLSFVRSTESLAMKVALHQFVPNPPGLIAVKEPSNRAF